MSDNYSFVQDESQFAGPYQGKSINKDAYLEYIKQYEGTPWYDQYLNAYNNYASQTFSPNFFQRIGFDFFNDASPWNEFENSRLSNFWNDFKAVQDAQHKEEYSNAVNQSSIMKQAGQNVDLNGGQVLSSTPSPAGDIHERESVSPAVTPSSGGFGDFVSIGSQILSFAVQAYQGFMNVKSLTLDNLQKEFSLSSSARDLAWNTISEGVTEYMNSLPKDVSDEDKSLDAILGLTPSIVQSFGSRINSLPLSRRQRKYMHTLIDELVYSRDSSGNKVPTAKYQTLINDTLSKLYGSRADATQQYGRIGADAEDIAVQRFLGNDLYRPLNEMALELQKDLNYVSSLQAQYDSSYLSQANKLGLPVMSASADFVAKKLQYEIKRSQNKVSRTFKAIDKKLEADTKIGPNWKMAFQTALAIGESVVMNNLINSMSSFSFGLNMRNNAHDTRDVYLHD